MIPGGRSSILSYTLALLVSVGLGGCAPIYYVGMPLVYDRADAGSAAVERDVSYVRGVEDPKRTVDLFLPRGSGWPLMIFVHGGGWNHGDKGLRVGGKDVYRNIGRYYAGKGIGVAVINYRLLPGVHWKTQLNDVADAVSYSWQRAVDAGADPKRLFLSGHSAGAQLATRVALDGSLLSTRGVAPANVCGVVAVSGGGYDMEDAETYALGAQFSYLQDRFGNVDTGDSWSHDASVVQFIDANSPPFLILYGEREPRSLQRQSQLLADVLTRAGVPNNVRVQPKHTHPRMVLAMTTEGRVTSTAIEDFVLHEQCGQTTGQ